MSGIRTWKTVLPPSPLDSLELAFEFMPPDVGDPLRSVPDELIGAYLWSTSRAVWVWMETSPRRRDRHFERRRALPDLGLLLTPDEWPGELADACEIFKQLVVRPASQVSGDVQRACRDVAVWAEERGRLTTALHFMELSARLDHLDPAPANLVARLSRETGHTQRAELWYMRAIGLSRAGRNVIEYINGHLGLATLMIEQCQYMEAMRRLRTAGSTARAAGLREQAAEAFHDALYIATMQRDIAKGTHFARRANAAYPKKAKRYAAFAYDVGLLLVSAGMYGIAMRLLRTVVRKIHAPAEQLVVWGTLTRAAAGMGNRSVYATAAAQVDQMAPIFRNTAAAALYSVAEGARLLCEWETAEVYVTRALAAARANGSLQIVTLATELNEEIVTRSPGRRELEADAVEGRALRNIAIAVHHRVIGWSPKA